MHFFLSYFENIGADASANCEKKGKELERVLLLYGGVWCVILLKNSYFRWN